MVLIVINDIVYYVFLVRTDDDHFLMIPNNADYVTWASYLTCLYLYLSVKWKL